MSHYDDIYLHDTAREDSEAEQERIDARLAELLADPQAVNDAYPWVMDTPDTIDLELAAIALSQMDADKLHGSDALATVLRWGRQARPSLLAKLEEIAADDVAEAAAFRPDMEDVA